ncbi:ATP-dependent RecD-like DNA helicase [Clostridium perfringens]|uniref:ATP-dependent RecD2 DNA helicase n=1 Tax=Clostridium perfringens F262 TaxID=883064 RepID=A0AAV3FAP9_CLOPF|nr:ATP-dependent RecD-like DNA helicase [Clostridium perfringens]EIA16377.1 helicase, RecD/TraA family protein [Clostridium perfringens F262]ELC8365582.1 ATP-dependent RecD-like DNA helicase [Clostridium perfringens]MBO3342258.1 ATP-dependent RecD-like DNA helicase [Clostridium perfringens]MBO3345331.1 ATP-dependent RecD-like DNA helicase [Clostridium perfringens]MBO3348403.1 ATP-dependent RecD-like DNA helicase [Clostridium perfringens]
MEALNGIVESIVFKSSDTGYTVIKFRENNIIHTAVGVLPHVKEGQNLKITGSWVNHSQFGKQFKVEECEEILPTSKDGIEKYLSSGIIQGIGPVTAKKIVNKFGEDTLNILDNNIERLKEIEGIGKKKLETIIESYREQRELKNITIFLQTHGLSVNQCLKIYKKYGASSVDTVKNNPYILCDEISGIGFKTSDKIARSLGIEIDSPFRIQSGIRYVINEFCANGHTFMPKDELIKEASNVLTVSGDIIEENIKNVALDRKIKLEKVNDKEGVFTIPNYYCELGITNRILTLAISNFQDISVDVDHLILQFEKKNNITFAESQKDAIISAFQNGIEIITGGPGTGKTTIIKCIIEIFETCGLKVLLGAPTGRAAKRMSESTGKEATTIHRMLDMGVFEKEESVFVTNADEHSLEADVVIIDEASMIDITLMNALLKSINVGTRLIIVGDVDQLPSVGAGNVLNDFIESGFTKVVRLKEIFRQGKESMIVVNAHKINKGEMPKLNEKGTDFFFIRNDIQEGILNTIIDLINTRLPRFNSNWDKLKSIQVLVPMKKGVLGVTNLNERIQNVLNPKSPYKKEKEFRSMVFREGDKVMQIKNNYSLKWTRIAGKGDHEGLGVFNGDMGFIESIDLEGKKLSIIFDDERRVIYDFMYLDELDLAYAITIHKSQGSEFPVVIIPAYMGAPLLMNRNLLYTGITRAKEMVVVVGIPKALKYMVDNTRSMERYSSLNWRIKEVISNEVFEQD